VQQAKLVHAPSLPRLPGFFGIWRERRIAFEDHDLMAVTSQHHRGTQPHDAPTDHDDPSHAIKF
jgi:hypothetical protein